MSSLPPPSSRVTRSRSREASTPVLPTPSRPSTLSFRPIKPASHPAILPEDLALKDLKGVPLSLFALLKQKQGSLGLIDLNAVTATPAERDAFLATLIFAQAEAGTAFCIHPSGLFLTCAHCIAESSAEYTRIQRRKDQTLLLTASGQIIAAICIAIDFKRDLALLRVVAAQAAPGSSHDTTVPVFSHMSLSPAAPRARTKIICVGQPGAEDLEADESGIATDYPVLHVSHGNFLGLCKEQDVNDNSEIGALRHNAWTYWGHSGAPLVAVSDGKAVVVGVHSSWEDSTGERRGVAWEAIKAFLEIHGTLLEEAD